MNKEKLCTKCKEIKPLSEYGRHRIGKDGFRSTCKECHNKENKLWRQFSDKDRAAQIRKIWSIKNQERIREKARQWKEEHKEKVRDQNREQMRQYRLKNKDRFKTTEQSKSQKRPRTEKVICRAKLNIAIQKQIIARPLNCSRCGSVKKITAHHTDYSQPLNVKWLCYECHGLEHRNN